MSTAYQNTRHDKTGHIITDVQQNKQTNKQTNNRDITKVEKECLLSRSKCHIGTIIGTS